MRPCPATPSSSTTSSSRRRTSWDAPSQAERLQLPASAAGVRHRLLEPLLLLSFRRASMSSLCELRSFFFSLLLKPLLLLAVDVVVAPIIASPTGPHRCPHGMPSRARTHAPRSRCSPVSSLLRSGPRPRSSHPPPPPVVARLAAPACPVLGAPAASSCSASECPLGCGRTRRPLAPEPAKAPWGL